MTTRKLQLTPLQSVQKRALDIALSLFILLLLFPMFLLIAALIKIGSPGPVMYRRRRYASDGREIAIYRFRTMRVTEDGYAIVMQAARTDDRLTRLGSFLRRTGLDELPSLVNVVRGDMSLVGPRPKHIGEYERYKSFVDVIPHTKPGITFVSRGLDFSSTTTMHDLYGQEKEYLEKWSIWLDLATIARTAVLAFSSRNAY
jgi:putative colanic acid biosysnthesis UDP-glucose lipid carrier transferase